MDARTIFDVIRNNRADIERVWNQVGGLAGLFNLLGPIERIITTIMQHDNPVQAIDQARKALLYSEETKAKVRLFQEEHGLKIDGLVGDKTWAIVEELVHGTRG